ncbi:MAG: hypothetical protein IT200_17860 [Thermoleophilia bacterium]|nr:hypothetical protein [Thermoleophilia bacterium]
MTVIRISGGPLNGVALETRRRSIPARMYAAVRALLPRRAVRVTPPAGLTDTHAAG